MIEVTDRAVEVLKRSLELGRVDPARGGVRLRMSRSLGGGSQVQVELADGPTEGEETVEVHGVRIFVGRDLTDAFPRAVVEVSEEHENIVVRAAGA